MRIAKTLGVATAVVFALTACAGAASASASVFEIPGAGPTSETTWNGALTGRAHVLGFDASGAPHYQCYSSTLSGAMQGESTTELTVSPTLGNCGFAALYGSPVKINGCQYRLHTSGSFDIINCSSPMALESTECEIKIGNQSGLATVSYTSTEAEGQRLVTVSAELTGINYTSTGGGGGNCGREGTYTDGLYRGEWLLHPQRFASEADPVTVTGTALNRPKLLSFGDVAGSLLCKYSGSGDLTPPQEGVSLNSTELSECTILNSAASVSMGGCAFDYNASGDFRIAGEFCDSYPLQVSAPSIEGGGPCTVTVDPTGWLAGFTPSNEGSGSGRVVKLKGISVPNAFSYTASGSGCRQTGTYSGTKPAWNLTLSARKESGALEGLWIE